MIKPVSIRMTVEDAAALKVVKDHFEKTLMMNCNTNMLFRLAIKKLAESIKSETNQRG